ncbi:efflux transporter outer membrane subunit [Pseudomonas fluorescens]|jgi:NodT family efflux transporter outer membrane factor (OMF) lipoprotein|uniref:RND transporter n=1 Tax=Pseudomonas aylmerensis TaxID=1869229 RepID=A0A2T4FRS6_9PSED|nr:MULTISPECIES: efflux transporter outer membrane subunit [Pseudomonas]MBS7842242.1 efflux transporter outer membrane subunit [Pseudomonas fluorescens]OCW29160.1 RND transporter [Pseudomonas aylmerensis]PTC26093.1 RND transporter [Pseudomonas aylmerensis]
MKLTDSVLLLSLVLGGCMVGPDYQKPAMPLPQTFKEGAQWQRAASNPQGALDSQWWLAYQDPVLNDLVARSAQANQSIIAAEAAYRLAQAQVASSRAGLWPTVGVGLSGSRGEGGDGTTSSSTTSTGVKNSVSATLTASWEPDLWGEVRRGIESSQAAAQQSDALLAGVRLSISSSVASNYLALRQMDIDVRLLQQQQAINQQLLAMIQAQFTQGVATNDQLLVAQDQLTTSIADLQTSQRDREQYEHALAVLVGMAPSEFSVAPRNDFSFVVPRPPLTLPSTLLQRRPDVVAAERSAAAANAKIGVAEAAFFPTLDLTAQLGYRGSALGGLFSLPNRIWTLGPALAETIFDGGAREAAVKQAEASYDQIAANYRGTVLSALQNVEDNLSAINHLQTQADAFQQVYQRNQQLFGSQEAQLRAGTVSRETVLTQQLVLLQAEQNLRDTQGQLSQGSVALIQSLGGGWQP